MATSLLEPEARRRTSELIASIEAQTSAEVVVAVRRQSGDYRAADWLAGAVAAFASLVLVLFLPQPFAVETIPLDLLVFFGLGAAASTRSPWLQRLLTTAATRQRNVLTGARATFVELGVSKTRRRNGLLVYVSLLERSVEVVTDVGIDPKALGPEWERALDALRASVAGKGGVAPFASALELLGPPLGRAMPRQHDDTDELSNEVGGA